MSERTHQGTDIPVGALWTPGNGLTFNTERAAAKAVEEYDPTLVLGQRGDTREWVVFLRKGPHGGEPFPIFGLGTQLPSADEIKKRLYHADIRRHGVKIFQAIQRRNDERQKELRAQADEASGIAAEAMEWGFRQQGAHPSPRVFIPSEVKSVSVSGDGSTPA